MKTRIKLAALAAGSALALAGLASTAQAQTVAPKAHAVTVASKITPDVLFYYAFDQRVGGDSTDTDMFNQGVNTNVITTDGGTGWAFESDGNGYGMIMTGSGSCASDGGSGDVVRTASPSNCNSSNENVQFAQFEGSGGVDYYYSPETLGYEDYAICALAGGDIGAEGPGVGQELLKHRDGRGEV